MAHFSQPNWLVGVITDLITGAPELLTSKLQHVQ